MKPRNALPSLKSLGKKRKVDKMTRIKYVSVPWDLKSYKKGEQEINAALAEGYQVVRDFETGAGIVVCLAKWENLHCDCEECT